MVIFFLRHRLQEPEIQNKIRNCVIDLTKIEVNSLKTIQIQDARKCATFLFDRLELLKKIEYILRQKKLLNHALYYIPKRKKVVHDFKLEKLNEFYCMIDSYINNFERRMVSTFLYFICCIVMKMMLKSVTGLIISLN